MAGASRTEPASGAIPRVLEVPAAGAALLLASPVIALAALLVRITSRGPAFFRQTRVGRGGRDFVLYKLRSMRSAREGVRLTAAGDDRVTAVGRLLRKSKLDELPQLWNVVRGDMSLVGPRPEVPEYVDLEDPRWVEILRWRPGITDPVAVRLRDEERVLAAVSEDRERFYREELQPEKLRAYIRYLRARTWASDVRVLLQTALAVLLPRRAGSLGEPFSEGRAAKNSARD